MKQDHHLHHRRYPIHGEQEEQEREVYRSGLEWALNLGDVQSDELTWERLWLPRRRGRQCRLLPRLTAVEEAEWMETESHQASELDHPVVVMGLEILVEVARR